MTSAAAEFPTGKEGPLAWTLKNEYIGGGRKVAGQVYSRQ